MMFSAAEPRRVLCREPGSLNTASHAVVEVIPSKDVKVSGALGPGCPIEKKLATAVADQVVGMGGTNRWRMAGLVGASLQHLLPLAPSF